MQKIPPRLPKGFRDSLPEYEQLRLYCVRKLEKLFADYAYAAIDTPILEYAEVLLGSSGEDTEKQIYRFTHAGKHDLAMRFDLTVPLARFIAAHHEHLPLPFRRYHIAKVFRGENTQLGRYREFYQCDFDIVGTHSVHADFEILRIAREALLLLDAGNSTIHLSHKDILPDFLHNEGFSGNLAPILRIIDKARKIPPSRIHSSLAELGLRDGTIDALQRFIASKPEISELREFSRNSADTLSELLLLLTDCGYGDMFVVDPSITRGLHYYTGMVFECFLDDHPDIGSICSGGRYDNLALRYTSKKLPGVGASIGLDRFLAASNKTLLPERNSVLVVFQDKTLGRHYQTIASILRKAGVQTEVYPEWRRLAEQFQYAEKKSLTHAVICGKRECTNNTVMLRHIATRQETGPQSLEDCIRNLKKP